MSKKTIMKTFKVKLVKETSSLYELESNGFVKSPYDAFEILKNVFETESMTKEHLMLASLNTKNKVVALHIVHIGSLNASVVHPREIMQLALLDNANAIMIGHNHPSGDPTPSHEDIEVTRRLVDSGNIIGIPLLDHIVMGDYSFSSLKEKGYI